MKNEVYKIITDRILEILKSGVAPWQKPWKTVCLGDECGAFFNLKTKKAYRGANVWILAASPFTSPYFVSFKQAQSMGGKVRKGEKGTIVTFWKPIKIEELVDGRIERKTIPYLRYYTVFNVEQCDGLEAKLPKKAEVRDATEEEKEQARIESIDEAEALVEAMPLKPEIRHGGGRAFYRPTSDLVGMPEREDFNGSEEYYSTLFHELVHSTGHQSRLSRKDVVGADGKWSSFGSPSYAKEELVAEMGAAFLCGTIGIENKTIDNSAAYLQSWCDRLVEDPKLFVHAAAAAQRAADFILGRGKDGKSSTDKSETTKAKDDNELAKTTGQQD